MPSQNPSFFERVVRWQRKEGRRGLPWQESRDPYRVWLSEVMLQQTQVAAVLGYYQRFLDRFPTVADLAAAPLDDVLALWSGLGYYARARNLHRAAQAVMEHFGGQFPCDPLLLAELPGVGRSTANAIAAFSFGARAAILDGNVKRVLARHLALDEELAGKAVENRLWSEVEARVPPSATHDDMVAYTQGMMDLGNLVCTRSRPRCDACPVAADCEASATGRQDELPRPKARKAIPERQICMLVLTAPGRIALFRRPDQGLWGGLWSLPQFDDEAALKEAQPAVGTPRRLPGFSHTFTHFRLWIEPHWLALGQPTPLEGLTWHAWSDAMALGLPQPVRGLLDSVRAQAEDAFQLQSQV